MTTERIRDCCPFCGQLNFRRIVRKFRYACEACGKDISAGKQLRKCPDCKSTDLKKQYVNKYICNNCQSAFDTPSQKISKGHPGNFPQALCKKVEVTV
ncbi:hypothetical protein MSHOH_2138 [Methanosarcina horonobensis HB-1 = JCM 15518]|uniref:Uncharacterized protein n=1 Tax=Methanosarcina horonobensis HB-1 = JCM 15518 TaxID=1434110 RepID=A0A0E3SCK8_9EURY|nr:hypothetical protein MSHOH_2138 [Methanosarcina horonobensis HB-1 = JCM 15518]